MPPRPDPRWDNILGGITPGGLIRPMSFEVLEEFTNEWAAIVPAVDKAEGSLLLLKTARSLFVHSWFDYEFMAVACLVALQAVEAAFRRLYPEAKEGTPFKVLVRRAHREGILPPDIADVGEAGVELRNLMSHPATQAAVSVGMAGTIIEPSHRYVALLLAAASARLS